MRDKSTPERRAAPAGGPSEGPPPGFPMSELSRRRWRVLSLTSIGAFMGPLDATIVSVALPTMAKKGALNLSYSEALWVSAAYLLVMAILLVPIGRLADAHGRMRFYLAGTAAFGVFSAVCAASPNGTFLIVARCFQSIGASCLAATSVALVTAVFPPNERGKPIGLNVMCTYLGLTAGPAVGGVIVSHTAWQWIFLVNVPIALATLANGWFLLPSEKRDRKALRAAAAAAPSGASGGPRLASGKIDWRGAVLLGIGLVCLIVPLTLVPFWGWQSARTIGLLVAAVVVLAGFVHWEGRVGDPLLDIQLVRKNHVFAAGTFAALLQYAGVTAVGLLTSVYLQVVEGYTAQRTGLLLLVQSVMMAALSPVFGRLSDKVGTRVLAVTGMMVCGAGILQLAIMPVGGHVVRVVLALATVGVGMALFSSPNTSAVMGSVQRHQLGVASGFLGTMRALGQALSLGLLGAIAATGLGAEGARVIFFGQDVGRAAAATFSDGYRTALFVAVGLSVLGGLVSLARGAPAQAAEGRH